MSKRKLVKNKCEIETCSVSDPNLLELHHIIERTEANSTNHSFNLAILCANCHAMTQTGRLKYVEFKNKSLKLFKPEKRNQENE